MSFFKRKPPPVNVELEDDSRTKDSIEQLGREIDRVVALAATLEQSVQILAYLEDQKRGEAGGKQPNLP